MNVNQENSISFTDNSSPTSERKQSPPAFLDLAHSAARLGTNTTDLSARVELKRMEHERQRLLQRKVFEEQMRVLEEQQAKELLNIPSDPNGNQPVAASAPTTPPRLSATLNGEVMSGLRHSIVMPRSSGSDIGIAPGSDVRKSVTYAPSVNLSPDLAHGPSFARAAGAKSMPASRRTSASEYDEELAAHVQNLQLGRHEGTSPQNSGVSALLLKNNKFGLPEGNRYSSGYSAGMMLDQQLDQEMHNAMLNLPTSDDSGYASAHAKLIGNSAAALDLANISQTSPRSALPGRTPEPRDKSSEWPQYAGPPRGTDSVSRASDRRVVTNPNLTLSVADMNGKLSSTVSASGTPLIPQLHGQAPISRRGSPSSLLEGISSRSVPTTPLGIPTSNPMLKPGTPLGEPLNGRLGDLPPLSGRLSAQFENGPMAYNGNQTGLDEQYEGVYGMDDGSYSPYGFEANGRGGSGSTALYHHNGSRYGLGLARGLADGKMNGLHGPKHKRGDIDREFNRFAGTRLEDLRGEIPALCKDQHGCRYLQKKLEEGIPEYRDMIFHETFGHFADLMTDPFGNYLCQKLLEYSTDEQRNVICESVAQDLVNISLNMHGTRAVQKMIDFLSSRRQADLRYNNQIHSIIVALSLHVVVLIKDLNGNHVIQKCLNKLSPEDNQFIYNAVAANCVEVATHRHGCCVLQRCIDHASDHQRVQLVNEITYNALTLVQDPYGNYVVQYILDLNDSRFSDAVIRQFQGNVCALSVQKFSSNVIEKCIRVAEHSTRKLLIEELLNRTRLEKLLRDSYGNYCVQTALDYAEPTQRALLVEGIRPVLPLIRNTPYGKRIQNKLQREQQMDHYGGYHGHTSLMGMGAPLTVNPHAARHLGQGMHPGMPLDVYGSQNGLYALGQNSFGQSHGSHNVQLDNYLLQNASGQGMPSHNGFTNTASFAPLNGAGLAASIGDYPRSSFGYGGM